MEVTPEKVKAEPERKICEACGYELRYRFGRWWHVESQDGFGPDKLVEVGHEQSV